MSTTMTSQLLHRTPPAQPGAAHARWWTSNGPHHDRIQSRVDRLNAFFNLIGDVRTPKRSAKPDFPGVGAAATDRWGPAGALRARKVSLYPQVMVYLTSGSEFVASLGRPGEQGEGAGSRWTRNLLKRWPAQPPPFQP